ncbi:MAG: hypothetical protein QW667_07275 [Candidatus Bathyarchaeia archaeon]
MAKRGKTFEKLLVEAIDEALSSLGESAKHAIYFHLQDKFGITKDEIPNRLEEFTEGLEKIFGMGARFIEILIMKGLYNKVGKPLQWDESKELVFTEYVAVAKKCFLKQKKT